MSKKLWVFGDSFTSSFKLQKEGEVSYDYVKYKGYPPKVFSEIISETININLIDKSIAGTCNQTMFHSFVDNINQINDDDIVIFGWTQNMRFNAATKDNRLFSILIGGANEKVYNFIDVSFESLVDLSMNRLKYSVFWTEVTDYIKVINHILKNNLVYHWTWVDPSNDYQLDNDNYQKEFYYFLIPFKKRPSITIETNNLVDDFHWGEEAHKDFAIEILKYIELNKNFNK